MNESITIVQLFKDAGLVSILLFILVGSYYKVWIWGSQLKEAKADWAAQLKKAEDESTFWKTAALQALGVAETSVVIANKRI